MGGGGGGEDTVAACKICVHKSAHLQIKHGRNCMCAAIYCSSQSVYLRDAFECHFGVVYLSPADFFYSSLCEGLAEVTSLAFGEISVSRSRPSLSDAHGKVSPAFFRQATVGLTVRPLDRELDSQGLDDRADRTSLVVECPMCRAVRTFNMISDQ